NYLVQLPYAIDNAIARFELVEANRRLQAELAERMRAEGALREHAAALAESGREKDQFLAMLGHELRNPLAPIRTALELLRRSGSPDAVALKAHEVMDRQIVQMVHLLDDLLEMSC